MRKSFVISMLLSLLMIVFCCAFDLLSNAAPEGMVYIADSYAMMGAEDGDLYAETNTKPLHLVYLDEFYIDKDLVTNEEYAVCVSAGACQAPQKTSSKTRNPYYGTQTFAKFPVINVTWQQASDYCAYVGKRLPTEAEWERAAKGNGDDRRYPWGNSGPKMKNMNLSQVPGDTEMVGIYAEGASPYGLNDMLGNVYEWTADWYDKDYYLESPIKNPQGPETGSEKTLRSSSYETNRVDLHLAARSGMNPESSSDTVGFRCARSLNYGIGYDGSSLKEEEDLSNIDFAYINAGNDNGIFILDEPGSGYDGAMIGVIPNGQVVEVLAGPVNINYTDWYQIETQDGYQGWTITSALVFLAESESE